MLIQELRQRINNETYADAIISAVLDCPRTQFKGTGKISDKDALLCEEIIKNWKVGVDLAYERGKWRFMDMPLIINQDVMPPVHESETLVNAIVNRHGNKESMLELGTGCGIIALGIAKNTNTRMVATDISEGALKVARQNARLNDVDVEFVQSDMFKQVQGRYDLIVSNPPSSPTSKLDKLAQDGQLNMPRVSREAGEDGFKFHRIIVANSPAYLKENGVLAFEICYDGQKTKDMIIQSPAFDVQSMETATDIKGDEKAVFARLCTPIVGQTKQQEIIR